MGLCVGSPFVRLTYLMNILPQSSQMPASMRSYAIAIRRNMAVGVRRHFMCTTAIRPTADFPLDRCPTEWVLLTSGTTGLPKMVSHSLGSLTAAINTSIGEKPAVWGTFYDVRRYGGLQVLFRAIVG